MGSNPRQGTQDQDRLLEVFIYKSISPPTTAGFFGAMAESWKDMKAKTAFHHFFSCESESELFTDDTSK